MQNFRPRCRGKLCLARRQTRRAGRTRSPCWIELGFDGSHPTSCRFLRLVAFVVQNFRPRCRAKLCLARRQTRRAGRTRSPCWIELAVDGISPYQLSLFALCGLVGENFRPRCREKLSLARRQKARWTQAPRAEIELGFDAASPNRLNGPATRQRSITPLKRGVNENRRGCDHPLKWGVNGFCLENRPGAVYWLQDEESDKAGTVCAVSDSVLAADRVGGEGVSHGARTIDAPHAAKIVNYAIA